MPVISTNTAANSAVRYLNANSAQESESLSKLASGSRINKASDDAAGLAISTRIKSDVSALEQAATNSSHAQSVLQTADGGASQISDILTRMKTLSSESSSGTVTDTERSYIEAEFSSLLDEIDGIASSTRYNGQSLLDGTSEFTKVTQLSSAATAASITTGTISSFTLAAGTTASFEINGTTITLGDAASTASQTIDAAAITTAINAQTSTTGVTATNSSGVLTLTTSATGADAEIDITNFSGVTTTQLGLNNVDTTVSGTAAKYTETNSSGVSVVVGSDSSDIITVSLDTLTADALGVSGLDISTQSGAEEALDALDTAIDTVSAARASIGATESRFEFRSEQISTSKENLESANSAIEDVDIAAEQAKLSSAEVKTQAAVAAAASANQMPQELLSLLK